MSLHSKHGKDAPKVLKGMMQEVADQRQLPEGFSQTFHEDVPRVTITNGKTSVTVSLCHHIGAVQAINAFCK